MLTLVGIPPQKKFRIVGKIPEVAQKFVKNDTVLFQRFDARFLVDGQQYIVCSRVDMHWLKIIVPLNTEVELVD